LHRDEIERLVKQSGLMLKELCLFTNPLTSGHLKTRYFLPFIPKAIVDGLEELTALNQGQLLPKMNAQTLAIIEKPSL
jgi:hypothetical protein